ncbi:hypothetical protein BC938DRAFT_477033 [Jimgerdemannia flammicorona]|uniref:Uncharacterized protein n=1 Tax=Jimgerdemannia flammicorona TaxID=994334 RepID=A0A433QPV9_9FUNG|nr:hypothetical protein BC938DRAFT_477033 [Jimgerdemannia flammicorona]
MPGPESGARPAGKAPPSNHMRHTQRIYSGPSVVSFSGATDKPGQEQVSVNIGILKTMRRHIKRELK